MKTITIGDLHGKGHWRFVDPANYDKIIFIGDYLDAFDVQNEDMLDNLLDVIEFKKSFPDKVVLLIGNHDQLQYVHDVRCSGFRPEMAVVFKAALEDNRKLFQAAFQHKNTIWTHAGIHGGWYKDRLKASIDRLAGELGETMWNISDELNFAYQANMSMMFDIGRIRGGGQQVGGPFWVDKNVLKKKPLKGYNQIVGHTKVDEIQTLSGVTFVDCLDSKIEFHELDL